MDPDPPLYDDSRYMMRSVGEDREKCITDCTVLYQKWKLYSCPPGEIASTVFTSSVTINPSSYSFETRLTFSFRSVLAAVWEIGMTNVNNSLIITICSRDS